MRKALRSAAGSLALAGALIAVPVAAQAAFTASTTVSLPVSTGVLTVPATAVSGSCVLRNGHNMITVVVNLTVTNPRATAHALRVFSPDGKIRYAGDAAALPEATFRVPGNEDAMAGKWRYEIRGDYTAPDTANTWTGKTVTGTFFCPPNPN